MQKYPYPDTRVSFDDFFSKKITNFVKNIDNTNAEKKAIYTAAFQNQSS